MTAACDLAIVGGGIVGLATALRFSEAHPGRRVVVLEKEAALARHQTGRNSGVLHTGIYYEPGSLKARLCREGKRRMEEHCEAHGVPFARTGKVIVATRPEELPRLDGLAERAERNGVQAERIGPEELREREPHAAGLAALWVPGAGVVDYLAACAAMERALAALGGEVVLGARVESIARRAGETIVASSAGAWSAPLAVNCAGLHCDRVARASGADPRLRIVPFRGEYYELTPAAAHLCRALIYPVPDPAFPFLGVHFTRGVHGEVECGPNAVLAFAREGYRWRDVSPRDALESLTYPGLLRLAARHGRMGLGEMWRSVSKGAFVRALQRLIPEVRAEHLVRAPAGVRAQALLRDGSLVDDFRIDDGDGVVHVLNAPSPAATASLAIGGVVAERAAARLAS